MENDYAKTAHDIGSLESRMRENRRKNQRRIERVEREELQIAKADEEYGRLERALRDAKASKNRGLLPGNSRLSLKNSDVMRVWLAIQGAFDGQFACQGLASNELYKAMRTAIPGIPDSTMRSHLHRLKKRGELTQIGSRWFLEAVQAENRKDSARKLEPSSLQTA